MKYALKWILLTIVLFAGMNTPVLLFASDAGMGVNSIITVPIAAPEFSAGKDDEKARFSLIQLDATGQAIIGLSYDTVTRRVVSDTLAWNFAFRATPMYGTVTEKTQIPISNGSFVPGTLKTDILMITFGYSLNGEYQALKNRNMNIIFFGGPLLTGGYFNKSDTFTADTSTSIWKPYLPEPWSNEVFAYYLGVQGGVYIGLKAGGFHIDPFGMISLQQGNSGGLWGYALDKDGKVVDVTGKSLDIGETQIISYGLTIEHLPSRYSFTAQLQESSKAGDVPKYKTSIFQVGLHWKFN